MKRRSSSTLDEYADTICGMETLGERLKRLRKGKAARMPGGRLGLRVVAKAAGTTHETYRQWEESDDPKIADTNIRALARYYGVTENYIRYGNGVKEPTTPDWAALEAALTMLDTVESALGASVPPQKKYLVIRQLYDRATNGTLDRSSAEDIISLAL